MADPELAKKLADLGARIDQRTRDMRERGEFGDVHAAAFADINHRRAEAEAEIAGAVAGGHVAGALRGEFARNVDALVDDFEAILFTIGADAARKRDD